MSMILHDWNRWRRKLLVKKTCDALPVGGGFIGIETLIDDAHRGYTIGMFLSLTMLMEFGKAFDFTRSESIS